MSTVRFATSNMFKRLGEAQVDIHIAKVTAQADVVVWEECTRDHRQNLRKLEGWDHYFSKGLGGLAISWRTDRFAVRRAGKSRAVVPGSSFFHDPTRGFIDIVLRDLEDNTFWPILCTHMTHQAFTSHPERRPRWRALATRLWLRSRRLNRRWGRVLFGGDVNRHKWIPKGLKGEWPDGGRGTHGGSEYDPIGYRGRVMLVRESREIHTPSDHDTNVAKFRSF